MIEEKLNEILKSIQLPEGDLEKEGVPLSNFIIFDNEFKESVEISLMVAKMMSPLIMLTGMTGGNLNNDKIVKLILFNNLAMVLKCNSMNDNLQNLLEMKISLNTRLNNHLINSILDRDEINFLNESIKNLEFLNKKYNLVFGEKCNFLNIRLFNFKTQNNLYYSSELILKNDFYEMSPVKKDFTIGEFFTDSIHNMEKVKSEFKKIDKAILSGEPLEKIIEEINLFDN
jgi:hypothetical protein